MKLKTCILFTLTLISHRCIFADATHNLSTGVFQQTGSESLMNNFGEGLSTLPPKEQNTDYIKYWKTSLKEASPHSTLNGTSASPSPFRPPRFAQTEFAMVMLQFAFSTLGLIGNTLNLVVLFAYGMTSSHIYIAVLAISDLFMCASVYFNTLWQFAAVKAFPEYATLYAYYLCYGFPLTLAASTLGIWITIAFTIDRYLAVTNPLTAATRSKKRTLIISLVVTVFSLASVVPSMFDRYVEYKFNPKYGQFIGTMVFSNLGLNQTYNMISFWLRFCLNMLIPFPLLAGFNILVIRGLFAASKIRKSMKESKNNEKENMERQISLILVTIVTVFFLCNIWSAVYTIAIATDRMYVVYHNPYWRVYGLFGNAMVSGNNCVNFLLYQICSREFRNRVKMLFTCGVSKPSPGVSSSDGRSKTTNLNSKNTI